MARRSTHLSRMVPRFVFFTSGVGTHVEQRISMQHAMRQAGLFDINLVKVSSVMPPQCEIITRARGLRMLEPGMIAHAVIAQSTIEEPHRRATVALGYVKPDGDEMPGYISELEEDQAYGKTEASAADEVGKMALQILVEKLGAKSDPERLWDRRKRNVRVGRVRARTGFITATAIGPEEKKVATAFAAAVYLL
jgi:arginine decarboxylase